MNYMHILGLAKNTVQHPKVFCLILFDLIHV